MQIVEACCMELWHRTLEPCWSTKRPQTETRLHSRFKAVEYVHRNRGFLLALDFEIVLARLVAVTKLFKEPISNRFMAP